MRGVWKYYSIYKFTTFLCIVICILCFVCFSKKKKVDFLFLIQMFLLFTI
ncbi:hypothetical protein HanRHA438_Chr16g0775081 [Helianthus annuus]|nr:hypothetical protein HanRHA438_Chr16g0775081 [Helianthus annuus]